MHRSRVGIRLSYRVLPLFPGRICVPLVRVWDAAVRCGYRVTPKKKSGKKERNKLLIIACPGNTLGAGVHSGRRATRVGIELQAQIMWTFSKSGLGEAEQEWLDGYGMVSFPRTRQSGASYTLWYLRCILLDVQHTTIRNHP